LLADPERAAAFGRAGRRRVEAEFSWDRIAALTLDVYREAMDQHRSNSA
jgi:starch synthase